MTNDSKPVAFQHGQAFLATISERWNYQILREVFFGTARFGELKRALGISANILTTRLNALTELGLLTRRPYREDKQWFEYELSDTARELVVPAIVAITRWAEERGPDAQAAGAGPRRPLLHTVCGQETEPYLACGVCHQPIQASNLIPLVADEN
ncbi:helix-turn-helix transcriptional regulator (plasmid) [Streptomyces viridifaciens]|nr:helix-turn-helix transcriptional regulator [Streptomyces viridifaciens]